MAWLNTSSATLLASALLFSSCSSLLYHPTRVEHVDRSKLEVKPEDFTFKSEDGTDLHAWNFHSSLPKPANCAILQFHGNGQNMTAHFYFLYWMLKYGYDFMTFDYHGYGTSGGDPTPQKVVEDGHAALRKMRELYPKKKIVVLGQSLGGAIALRSVIDMKDEIKVASVVIDSSFASYRSAARSIAAHSWITWLFQPIAWLLMNDEYAPKDRLNELAPIPLLVAHGDRDPIIDLGLGQDLYDRMPEPKEFWLIPGGGHTALMANSVYAQKLIEKLDKLCRQ